MTNEALRDHVTSAAFVLNLGKTHVAELVRMDIELAAEVKIDNRKLGKLYRCDITARRALESRGLVIWVWPLNERRHQFQERGTGRWVRNWDSESKPGEHWNITRAGRLVIELLQEAGIYQEYAGPVGRLLEIARDIKRSGAVA